MKRIRFSRKQILRAIHAACVALFYAACASQTNAAPPPVTLPAYNDYTVSGSTVSAYPKTTNSSSAYFFDSTSGRTYAITVGSTSILGNTMDQNKNELEFASGSVTNAGTLSASYDAIDIYTTGTVTNAATGRIEGFGVLIGGNGTVTNSGYIAGIDIGGNGSVTNNQGGSISNSFGIKILGNGTVTNSGSISTQSLYGPGVQIIGNGTVNNNSGGTISGYYSVKIQGVGTVNNNSGGSISGSKTGVDITDAGTVTNAGSISGSTNTNSSQYAGVYIGGNGTVVNNHGGTISGYYGVNIRGNGTVTNAGTISSTSSYGTGVFINGTGTVNNTGMISSSSSYGTGVYIAGNGTGTVTVNNSNGGSISGYTGVNIKGAGTVTNAGMISSTSSYGAGVQILGDGTLTNNSGGSISGYTAVYIKGTGTVINNQGGSISGYYTGVYIKGAGTVTNAGSISGSGYGVDLRAGGTVINQAGGTISGYGKGGTGVLITGTGAVTNQAGGTISGDYSVYITGNGTVTNSGTITDSPVVKGEAVYIGGTGSVSNTDRIIGNNYGIDIIGDGTVTNSGYISGTNSVYIGGNGTVINSGIITDGKGGQAVYIGGTGSVSNTGSITGNQDGIDINGRGNVYNSGSIVALNGASTGVFLNGSGSSLLSTGGTITGSAFSIDLGSGNSTVTIQGRTQTDGDMIEGNGHGGNVLNLNLAGVTPAQAATLDALSGTGAGGFTIGAYTYNWIGFANSHISAVSLEQVVDPGLTGLATKIDNNPLPPAFDALYAAAAANPEAALNELVGREINQGSEIVGLNLNTTLTSDLNQHLDNLFSGNQIGGLDVGGLQVSDAADLYAFSNTTSQLNGLVSTAAQNSLAGTSMSTDAPPTFRTEAPQPRWGVWASGNVTLGNESSTSTLPGFRSKLGSPTLGVDFRITPHLVLGVLATATTGDANFTSGSQVNLNTEIGALYGTWSDGNWHVNGIAGGGASQFQNHRATFGGTANSSPNGDDIVTDWTGGYDFHLGDRWNITPELGAQYTHLDIDSFSETGAGVFDLNVGSQSIDSLRSHVGFKVDKAYSLGKDLTFIPELRALWYHEFLDNSRGVNTSLPGAPALGSFSASTFSPQRDFALLGVGLNTAFTGYKGMPVGMFLNYDVQVGQSDYIANSVNTGIRFDF